MNGMTLELHGATEQTEIAGVTSFVGEDPSGQFGILPGHDRFATVLVYGMARFRCGDAPWRYIALPGGTLHVDGDRLRIGTRFYSLGDDYRTLGERLGQRLLDEERHTERLRDNLARLERSMLRRLWQMDRR